MATFVGDNSAGHCINSALSILRQVLGYDQAEAIAEWTQLEELPPLLGKLFYQHTVTIWTGTWSAQEMPANVRYAGSGFDSTRIRPDAYYAFCYYDGNQQHGRGHMVIGQPVQYGGLPAIGMIIEIAAEEV